jgi:hypothetical protein
MAEENADGTALLFVRFDDSILRFLVVDAKIVIPSGIALTIPRI